MVVLFTSHAALRSSYAAIKPILEARGILVLGHGIDGSPRQLWQIFSSQERVVLLGTGFFWDSIGEVSRMPTCTVVTRLPMPVPMIRLSPLAPNTILINYTDHRPVGFTALAPLAQPACLDPEQAQHHRPF